MYTQPHQIPPPEESNNFWHGPAQPTQSSVKFPPSVAKQEYTSHHPHHTHPHHHHHHHHEISRSTQELGKSF